MKNLDYEQLGALVVSIQKGNKAGEVCLRGYALQYNGRKV